MMATYRPAAYAERLRRGEREHGDKWDPSSLEECPGLWRFYASGQRVRVRFKYGEEMTGRVSTTTGWRPAFLLVRRSSDHGSSWLLGPDDVVVAVHDGRQYVPVAPDA